MFLTADCLINELSNVTKGETVLIHASSGGTGLAAVQIALAKGAIVIGTASDSKRGYVKSEGASFVFNSRDTSFADDIMKITDGKGVDMILNSLTSEGFIEASLSVLKKGGRFVEIGKRNIWSDKKMKLKRPDVHYYVLALDDRLTNIHGYGQKILNRLNDRFVGVMRELHPLRTECFPVSSVQEAFHHMQMARQIGKIVIQMSPRDFSSTCFVSTLNKSSVVISGGTGALGLLSAQMLLSRGVGRVILLSRSGQPTVKSLWDSMSSEFNSRIKIIKCDVTNYALLKDTIKCENESMPNGVCGIIHCAGVLDDGLIKEQTIERFKKVWEPKVNGALNLERAIREYKIDPSFFILFSSSAALFGNVGQSGYAAANGMLDSIACRLRADDVCATSIQWGPWDEIGMAAGMNFAGSGTRGISNDMGMNILWNVISAGRSIPCVVCAGDFDINELSEVLKDSKFLELGEDLCEICNTSRNKSTSGNKSETPLVEMLSSMKFKDARDHLITVVAGVFTDISEVGTSVDADTPLTSMGLGSLGSVELRNTLQVLTGLKLSPTLVYEHSTIRALAVYLLDVLDIDFNEISGDSLIEKPKLKSLIPFNKLPVKLRVDNGSIAITGIGCQFPGDSNSASAFWKMLCGGIQSAEPNPPLWRKELGGGGSFLF